MSLTIPPRVRGFALATGGLFIAPGLFVGPLSGYLSDNYGVRAGILVLVPVFLIGAAIFGTAASSVEADMRAGVGRRGGRQAHLAMPATARWRWCAATSTCTTARCRCCSTSTSTSYEGEIMALLGTNGAGKSTLLHAIAGTTVPSNGAIFFDGDDITFLPPLRPRRARDRPGARRPGRVPVTHRRENLDLAGWPFRDDRTRVQEATETRARVVPATARTHRDAGGRLSGGEQQMLTLGQAFLAQPKLLMIDELSLGLAPAIVEQLLQIVRDINDNGTTIILVEQSVNVALTVAHRAVFMEKGEIRFTGPTAELLERGDILRSVFLGRFGGAPAAPRSREV